MKAIIVLSGGQDSTTCGFWAKQQGYNELHAVTFNYGQRHARELKAARKIGQILQVDTHEFLDLGANVLCGTSPLVSGNELEQYKDFNSLPGGLEKTFVPMRNQLFLTIAANRAYVQGCNTLITGVCEADNGGYPDCTKNFINAIERASTIGTFTGAQVPGPLQILTPLMHLSKKETVLLSLKLEGCYQALAYTHTSYDGAYPPTGHDHATLLRAKGFAEAGVPDPLILRAMKEGALPMDYYAESFSPNAIDFWMKRANL